MVKKLYLTLLRLSMWSGRVLVQLIRFLPERRRAGLWFSLTSSQCQQDEEVWSPGTSAVVT